MLNLVDLNYLLLETLIDKNENLLPENLRRDVHCLGVTGTFDGGSSGIAFTDICESIARGSNGICQIKNNNGDVITSSSGSCFYTMTEGDYIASDFNLVLNSEHSSGMSIMDVQTTLLGEYADYLNLTVDSGSYYGRIQASSNMYPFQNIEGQSTWVIVKYVITISDSNVGQTYTETILLPISIYVQQV